MEKLPKVSVVVPCRNESEFIEECIRSLISGACPGDALEILVVEGGNSSSTRERLDALARKYRFLRIVSNPEQVTPSGLNIGVRAARGDVIIIASAHARYGEGYVSRCVEALESNGVDCVGGPMKTVPSGDTPLAEAICQALSCRFGVGNALFRVSSRAGYVDTVPFGAYRRGVFDRIGLFDGRLVRNQDIEFNSRLRKNGGRIYMTPRIQSYYRCRRSLGGLWEQNFQNGMWNIYTMALTGNSLSWRHFVPLCFVAALLVSAFSAVLVPAAAWVLAVLVGVYAAATIATCLTRPRGKFATTPLFLPVVFPVLHLSYGLGSLWGLATLRKVLRNGYRNLCVPTANSTS